MAASTVALTAHSMLPHRPAGALPSRAGPPQPLRAPAAAPAPSPPARERRGRAALRAPLLRLGSALKALSSRMELRIDVESPPAQVEEELKRLQARFDQRLRAHCTLLALPVPGLHFWHREADGEHYLYVECTRERRLVGHAVLNRLIEIARPLDPHVRSPHTRIDPAFQGRGIASALYRWALDQGFCLVSGARQSPGAHALWRSLGRQYHLAYVQLVDRELRLLGPHAPTTMRGHLHTRLMLFGVNARPAQANAEGKPPDA